MKNSTAGIAIAAIAFHALCAAPAATAGTTAWRCGNTYTDQPCPGGQALSVDDSRDAAQKREADRAIREAQAAGERLERERVREEKAQAGRAPTLIDNKPVPRPGAESTAKKKKGKKEPEHFSAHDPVTTAKKKAEKKAEKTGKATRPGAERS